MNVDINWDMAVVVLEKVGIAGICLAVIFFGYQLFKLFLAQWQNSTDAVNKNTEAFLELSNFFKKANEREEAFQKQIMEQVEDGVSVAKDTNKRVRDIQNRI